ncbi:MAG: acetyltransferase [Fibrobacteres bacterium]|nr:acetyltransferase [Fibrobacterota bacterium]
MNNPSFAITQAAPADVALIAPLFDAYRVFYEADPDLAGAVRYLLDRLTKGESRIFFAWQDGPDGREPMGFTQLYPSFSSVSMQRLWILNDLYVAPAFRKRGAGAALMERARAFALEDGAKGLSLATQNHNHSAQALYEKMGYGRDTEFLHFHLLF